MLYAELFRKLYINKRRPVSVRRPGGIGNPIAGIGGDSLS